MEEEKKLLTVSASPHVKSPATVRGIMLDVIISLIPAVFAGIAVFGGRAAAVIAVSVASCVIFEAIAVKIMKKPMCIGDLSAVITGLLLAFNLPVTIPLWMCVLGSFVAIVVVKQLFGGIGQNFANPAITARIVLLVSFASAMTNFTSPKAFDAVTSATPLSFLGNLDRAGDITAEIMKLVGSGDLPDLFKMFLGVRAGCIGEVCSAALLLGAVYLMVRRVISPIIPCCFIGTVTVMMFALSGGSFYFTVYEVLGGGLLLGAFFMATDYSTSPINKKGKVLFGIGCGIITSVIRLYGSLPEGVSYSILLMNVMCPLIEKFTAPKYFGFIKSKKKKEAA
ncbi:MAG: RnfABCDGE type electron transport complex subunit D [Oscillospiraceae bacterium]|nr:RnfABCDGE type electron transport complex subunit D [Oscillospiraceae bacterium]